MNKTIPQAKLNKSSSGQEILAGELRHNAEQNFLTLICCFDLCAHCNLKAHDRSSDMIDIA